MTILINRDIPRTMNIAGLEYLGKMARSVPENGIIVEVGPLYGSATWVLAQNSHPSVKVISIDTWEPAPWISNLVRKFPDCLPFSKEAFLHYTQDCENVEAVQGWSPTVMQGRDEPINLFFDAATRGDPGFSESLAHYVPQVIPGGIVCGDDFAAGWPDIVRNVYSLGEEFGTSPEVSGRVWSLLKPEQGGETRTVYDVVGDHSNHDLMVSTKTVNGQWQDGVPNVWAGKLHQFEMLNGLKIELQEDQAEIAELGGQYQLKDIEGGVSEWTPFGLAAEMEKPIVAIRAHLTGQKTRDVAIDYQVCGIDLKKRKTRNSKNYSDGEWATIEGGTAPVAAVRIACKKAA